MCLYLSKEFDVENISSLYVNLDCDKCLDTKRRETPLNFSFVFFMYRYLILRQWYYC